MNTSNNYSSSVDSLEIWSSPLQQSTSYDSWNVGMQNSPSRLSWEDVGSLNSSMHQTRKRHDMVFDSVEEPSNMRKSIWQSNNFVNQITSPNVMSNDHDLLRSVDQLLLDDGTDDGGDIFEFDMGDNYAPSSMYNNNTPGRPQYRRRVICKFYQNGNCKAGNKCRFSHDTPSSHYNQPSTSTHMQSTTMSSSYQPTSNQSTPIKNNNNGNGLSTSPQVSRFSTSPMASYNNNNNQMMMMMNNQQQQQPVYGVTTNGIKYCKFFLGGFCRAAENCPYSHLDQQQLLQFNNQPSFEQTYSSPRNHHNFGQHQHMFQSPMNTIPTLSSSLPMPHTEFSPGTSPPLSDSSGSSSIHDQSKICPFFMKGDCRYGDRCRNMHTKLTPKKKLINEESLEKFSKIPCKYYRQGHCPFGDTCYYLHQNFDHVNNFGMYQNIPMYYEEQLDQFNNF